MAGPKTMRDARTLHSMPARNVSGDSSLAYLHLHRLASEKLRLEKEMEMWLRKKERLDRRLDEIEVQMESLRQSTGRFARSKPEAGEQARTWNEITLEY